MESSRSRVLKRLETEVRVRAGGSALAVEAVAGGAERGGEAAFAVGEVAAGHVGVDQLGGFLEFPKLAGAFWSRRLGRLVSERGVADEFLEGGTFAGRRVGQGVLLEVFQKAAVADTAALGCGVLVPLKIFFPLILFPAVTQIAQGHGVVQVLDFRRVGQDFFDGAAVTVVAVERLPDLRPSWIPPWCPSSPRFCR